MPTVRHGRPAWRVRLSAGLLSVLAWGCATPHPLAYTPAVPEAARRGSMAVAVRPIASPSGASPQLGGKVGKGSATGQGATTGAATGAMAGLLTSLQTGPFFVLLAPILVPAGALVGGAGGAAVGYAHGIPRKEAEAAQALLARNQADLSAELAQRVARRLPGLGKVQASPGVAPDLRIDVSALSWGLYGGAGAQPVADFELTVGYGVLDGKGAMLLFRQFTVGGPRRPLQAWAAEDGRLLRQAVERAVDEAAEAVCDATFLIQDFHLSGDLPPLTCGLLPLRPGPMFLAAPPFRGALPKVEDCSPVLRWEAFPRQQDLDHDQGGVCRRIGEVCYDLRIWVSVGGGPGDLVYERTGLHLEPRADPAEASPPEGEPRRPARPAAEHRVEAVLAPATEYLWSVRARFTLDGVARATRWSMNQSPDVRAQTTAQRWFRMEPLPPRGPCLYDGIPPLRHHRFRTP
ncbi:hypothetical protein [Geothrix oryzisoli]|uniref:hypothetical protein n=1 Tax=Geothrix oryzisoli TaxID=2922721 RepID=UPI001FAC8141|nr:hypothetical protein [Geothrix oryzisoli]